MLYLDTSALLKLFIREQGSEEVQMAIESQDHPLPVWEIQEMELTNALRLKVFWGELELAEAERQLALFEERFARGLYFFPEISRPELRRKFRELSARTPQLGCGTMDILHVACACQLEAGRFLTFDERQATLAREAGLKV